MPTMSRLDVKFEEINKLDQMLYDVSMARLHALLKELGIESDDLKAGKISSEALFVFIESWSRTLAQTLK